MPGLPGSEVYNTRREWREQLNALPTLQQTGGSIPSIFLAHGQPMLIWPDHVPMGSSRMSPLADLHGPKGYLAEFLRDLGPALMEKYKPRAIVVFSAHWETSGETLVSDWGDENPLLYDCERATPLFDKLQWLACLSFCYKVYGFPPDLYKITFSSSGDSILASHIVQLLKAANIKARTTSREEMRGEDGRGYEGVGLDHGVFVPFKLMLGERSPVPIVQVSISSSYKAEEEWALGAALASLRSEGVLLISGGLTLHTFADFTAFSPKTAKPIYFEWEKAIVDAAIIEEANSRKKALINLMQHPGARMAHPRPDHFVPLYVAAGAANDDGGTSILSGLFGAKTIAFGV